MTDPRFAARARDSLLAERLPKWTHRAACAGRDTSDWLADDVADRPSPRFPERVYRAMKVCWACPVRTLCLEYAFETEQSRDWGYAEHASRHEASCDMQDCEGCAENGIRLWTQAVKLEPLPAGVFGGAPGVMRERYVSHPQRVEALGAWLASVALERHWEQPQGEGAWRAS